MSNEYTDDDAVDFREQIYLSPEDVDEVKRRMAESDADPSSLLTLEQVWERVGKSPSKNS